MTQIEMVPVRSTMVAAVGYDLASRILRVQFSKGKSYDYEDVPESEVLELMRSNSVGSFVNSRIKGVYRGSPTLL